ncbi:MAG: tRNA (adenosine(37)-N6)-dimethylallyltransferase MiaA, partial [Acidobacteriota bacterium]|nr:tRNA (adenosine(37)-N6)-dimethylallyltransferase MiaA [Acidobacteriota bacterium]
FESLGYSQAVAHLQGRLSREEAVTLTQQATRQYAKRQMTWFRRERDVQWFQNFGTAAEVQSEAVSYLRNTIK